MGDGLYLAGDGIVAHRPEDVELQHVDQRGNERGDRNQYDDLADLLFFGILFLRDKGLDKALLFLRRRGTVGKIDLIELGVDLVAARVKERDTDRVERRVLREHIVGARDTAADHILECGACQRGAGQRDKALSRIGEAVALIAVAQIADRGDLELRRQILVRFITRDTGFEILDRFVKQLAE